MGDAVNTQELQLTLWLRVLRRRLSVFVVTVLVIVAAAAVFLVLRSATYEAHASIAIASSDPNSVVPSEFDVASVTQLAGSDEVERRALQSFSGDADVSVADVQDVALLTFQARAQDPQLAAEAANAYASALVAVRTEAREAGFQDTETRLEDSISALDDRLEVLDAGNETPAANRQIQQLQSERDGYVVALRDLQVRAAVSSQQGERVVAPASPPTAPVGFPASRILVAAFVLGALVAAGTVGLAEFADRTVRVSGTPPVGPGWLGVVPRVPDRFLSAGRGALRPLRLRRARPFDLVFEDSPDHPAAQAYRALRTTLLALSSEAPPKVLLVTSAADDDGAASAASNIALSIAVTGRPTFLVSLDFRHPHGVAAFPADVGGPGFAGVLDEGLDLDDVATTYLPDSDLLRLVPAGTLTDAPSDRLARVDALELMDKLAAREEIVILLLPPALSAPESALLASTVESTLVVARQGRTHTADLDRAVDRLEDVGARLLGVVLVDVGRAGAV